MNRTERKRQRAINRHRKESKRKTRLGLPMGVVRLEEKSRSEVPQHGIGVKHLEREGLMPRLTKKVNTWLNLPHRFIALNKLRGS